MATITELEDYIESIKGRIKLAKEVIMDSEIQLQRAEAQLDELLRCEE